MHERMTQKRRPSMVISGEAGRDSGSGKQKVHTVIGSLQSNGSTQISSLEESLGEPFAG